MKTTLFFAILLTGLMGCNKEIASPKEAPLSSHSAACYAVQEFTLYQGSPWCNQGVVFAPITYTSCPGSTPWSGVGYDCYGYGLSEKMDFLLFPTFLVRAGLEATVNDGELLELTATTVNGTIIHLDTLQPGQHNTVPNPILYVLPDVCNKFSLQWIGNGSGGYVTYCFIIRQEIIQGPQS